MTSVTGRALGGGAQHDRGQRCHARCRMLPREDSGSAQRKETTCFSFYQCYMSGWMLSKFTGVIISQST